MRTSETTIDIHASPGRVWAVMSDIERWHEWTASITTVQRLDEGQIGVGSKARVKQHIANGSLKRRAEAS